MGENRETERTKERNGGKKLTCQERGGNKKEGIIWEKLLRDSRRGKDGKKRSKHSRKKKLVISNY